DSGVPMRIWAIKPSFEGNTILSKPYIAKGGVQVMDENEFLRLLKERNEAEQRDRPFYASFFAKPLDGDCQRNERYVLERWLEADPGHGLSNFAPGADPKKAPDFTALRAGLEVGVEVTELVDEAALSCAQSGLSIADDVLIWDRQKFFDRLLARINDKQLKYARNSVFIDSLLVHSDDWLSACAIEEWLPQLSRPTTPNIERAWLLLTYDDRSPLCGWAVFRVF
ncbi:MAG TPA: hypothetical protein VG841_03090, partial [Caulobacterales bacterium]|nr:hypothetical protein [Caulobacterales bacterium]